MTDHIGGTDSGASVTWARPPLGPAPGAAVRWRCELRETPAEPHTAGPRRDTGAGPAPSAAVAMRWLTTSLLTVCPLLSAQRSEALTDWAKDPWVRDVLMRALDRLALSVSVEVTDDRGALTWHVEPVAAAPPAGSWLTDAAAAPAHGGCACTTRPGDRHERRDMSATPGQLPWTGAAFRLRTAASSPPLHLREFS
ncbi:hypothetical protein [Streptomyces sp. NPDC045470]|uniref:hypothetical protein n=1 Tax=Streptomyces sp. NPDC045470 TaxID=3155469 RepID=UPI0033C86177